MLGTIGVLLWVWKPGATWKHLLKLSESFLFLVAASYPSANTLDKQVSVDWIDYSIFIK